MAVGLRDLLPPGLLSGRTMRCALTLEVPPSSVFRPSPYYSAPQPLSEIPETQTPSTFATEPPSPTRSPRFPPPSFLSLFSPLFGVRSIRALDIE